jgi:hypothetical protein
MNFLSLLFALILSAVKARIVLTYPENNETAKKAFVMLFSKFDIDRIRDCGDKLSVSQDSYKKCIKDLNIPKIFEKHLIDLKMDDFFAEYGVILTGIMSDIIEKVSKELETTCSHLDPKNVDEAAYNKIIDDNWQGPKVTIDISNSNDPEQDSYDKIIDDNWQDHNNAIDISSTNDPEQEISSTNNSDQKVVTDKKDAITACKSEKDLVDSFPEKYNKEKSVEQAMEAYSAALVKSNEVVLKEEKKESACDVMFYIMYAAVGIFVIAGFFMIVYAYFIKKSEESDL